MTESEKLKDVYKIKKILDEIESLDSFRNSFPIIKPYLKAFNVDVSTIEKAFQDSLNLIPKIKEFSEIPDRFNDLLSTKGWIMFERMNIEIVKDAIKQAELGNFENADEILISYFNPEFVERELKTMATVAAFRPRMTLAELALEDYRNERYHACIPVLLAQIDGLVNDLHEKRIGFFAEGAKMEAWDSIAAHSKGLNQLTKIFGSSRTKTSSEEIRIPFRHGIMHGRDLGYANKTVAAKSWAALFAVREWAIKVERNELGAPPEKPELSFGETINSIVEINNETKRWKNWEPRIVSFENIGISPSSDNFGDCTPEKAVSEFLFYWKRKNYGFMGRYIPKIFIEYSEKPIAAQIRENFVHKNLIEYTFKSIDHTIPSSAKLVINIIVEIDGKLENKDISINVINENSEGEYVAYGNPKGKWVIFNWNSI
ncbi:MAG: hypothetical protein CVU40_17195 [Chloroflexi bacterium HGW-Chloroflexi-2]|nr:MAG: hypothetical protein CVU40_17195 [Chloroflexi bacterium HGW-Chloroflexi-2]